MFEAGEFPLGALASCRPPLQREAKLPHRRWHSCAQMKPGRLRSSSPQTSSSRSAVKSSRCAQPFQSPALPEPALPEPALPEPGASGARCFQPVYGRRRFQPAQPLKKPKNRQQTRGYATKDQKKEALKTHSAHSHTAQHRHHAPPGSAGILPAHLQREAKLQLIGHRCHLHAPPSTTPPQLGILQSAFEAPTHDR